ncbi:DNA/RNA non-specific endonuclease [Hymenobacter sp. BT507]|uniref:DNA/RNA non-specific endonuclease n=1 Tax=Hymenobacter citatus TaxID=2763506 RepID=A0ABR7MEE9_9BACT|nr:DNA/RNA non-specific endonuclease [Hymenobacter citatus]MBC6609459.1 DNA/RNA non-specific endonuclease [Hymenobacter citatus]
MARLFLLLPLALLACSQQSAETHTAAVVLPTPAQTTTAQAAPPLTETFETGSKGAYATADEALPSGSWHFVEALIGTSDQDHKDGLRAARLRAGGRLGMNFDAPTGVRTIRISSASYGTDPASTWELWLSQDGGRRYARVGQPVRTAGAGLLTTTFTVPQAALVRLEIRKVDTGKGRLNIDDIELLSTSSGTTAPPPSPTTQSPSPSVPTQTPKPPRPQDPTSDPNLLLGNPSGATTSLSTPSNYLMTKPQYTLGYNAQRGTPTWVSWHLSKAEMGSAPRQDDFRPDPALPRQFYQVTPKSYSGSGFDKGHNCPSADRTYTLDDNSATFLMTNMIPQAPNNNQRTWSALEEYGRSLVKQGKEIYIVMGSYGRGGVGANGPATTIDQGRVTVPKRVWKVLVVLPEGANDLQRIAAGQARIIAIDTPNDNSVSPNWGQYRVSLDALEAATGLDMLSALPVAAQTRLQAGVDAGPTR